MNSTPLRIQFKPLLKEESETKCAIEIVPEVSGYHSLDKLDWTSHHDGQIEYTIPITYKIFIKQKEDAAQNMNNKTYHSCVDLLPSPSYSSSNFASGDVVARITSDYILSKIASDVGKCNIMLTDTKLFESFKLKDLSHRVKSPPPRHRSLCTVHRSVQIDCSRHNKGKNNYCENWSNTTTTQLDETNPELRFKSTETSFLSTNTNETLVNEPRPNPKTQKQLTKHLSITPICSINTSDHLLYDKMRGDIDSNIKKETKPKILKEFVQRVTEEESFDPLILNNTYLVIGQVHDKSRHSHAEHNQVLKTIPTGSQNHTSTANLLKAHVGNRYHRLKHTAPFEDLIYEAQKCIDLNSPSAKTAVSANDLHVNWKHNFSKLKDINKFFEIQNTLVQLQGDNSETDINNLQKFHEVKFISPRHRPEETYGITGDFNIKGTSKPAKKITQNHKISENETHELSWYNSDMAVVNKNGNNHLKTIYKKFLNKIAHKLPQNVRVANHVRSLQKEIFPLMAELNNIRNKCVSYGIISNFASDTTSRNVCTSYESIPSTASLSEMTEFNLSLKSDDVAETQEHQTIVKASAKPQDEVVELKSPPKSNRVVYTVLHNET